MPVDPHPTSLRPSAILACALVFGLATGTIFPVHAVDVPVVRNGATPAEGMKTLEVICYRVL